MVAIHQLSHKFALRSASVHLKAESGQTLDGITYIEPLAALTESPKALSSLPASVGCLAEVGVNDQISDRLARVQSAPPQERLEHRQQRLVELLRGHDGV